jgi:hypothetical protein
MGLDSVEDGPPIQVVVDGVPIFWDDKEHGRDEHLCAALSYLRHELDNGEKKGANAATFEEASALFVDLFLWLHYWCGTGTTTEPPVFSICAKHPERGTKMFQAGELAAGYTGAVVGERAPTKRANDAVEAAAKKQQAAQLAADLAASSSRKRQRGTAADPLAAVLNAGRATRGGAGGARG